MGARVNIDGNTGGIQVEFDPANFNIVYGSMWEHRAGSWENGSLNGKTNPLFKSIDGGLTSSTSPPAVTLPVLLGEFAPALQAVDGSPTFSEQEVEQVGDWHLQQNPDPLFQRSVSEEG